MTFSDWFGFARTNWKREEGQTMAEYGVVLAVITIGAVAVFTALSGGIRGALSQVIGLLPGAGS
jgi:Flp pilus assembly pilin Flp